MAKLYILADKMTANGLMLGGVQGVVVADESDVSEKALAAPQDTRTILVTSGLAKQAAEALEKLKKKGVTYSVIPDMTGGREDITKHLIKEAIGFELS